MKRISLLAAVAAILLTGAVGRADEQAPASPYAGTGDLAIDKPEDKVDVPPIPAPEGAIVLFNGGDICKAGPLKLQDHGHPVQFRNIWATPLK